jgi:hypothetical protein
MSVGWYKPSGITLPSGTNPLVQTGFVTWYTPGNDKEVCTTADLETHHPARAFFGRFHWINRPPLKSVTTCVCRSRSVVFNLYEVGVNEIMSQAPVYLASVILLLAVGFGISFRRFCPARRF